MEVVSPESVLKDKELLRRLYFDAGVQEYWLIDARGERIEFEVLQRGARSFRRAPSKAGWRASSVFGKSFKLTRKKNRVEHWTYRLEIK